MFESLSEKLGGALRRLSGRGKITEDNVREAMADVRTALLEADVHVEVVRDFCDSVVQEAIGGEVTKSLNPAQEIVGLVHKKLVSLMGPVDPNIMSVVRLARRGQNNHSWKIGGALKRARPQCSGCGVRFATPRRR